MKRVLLVDGDFDHRAVAATTLSRAGFFVIEAKSEREALEAAKDGRPDLILLDVSMPGLSGRAAALLSKLPGRPVPVLAFTANALQAARALASYDGCLSKPCAPPDLLAAVCRLLR